LDPIDDSEVSGGGIFASLGAGGSSIAVKVSAATGFPSSKS
jgi:hypothetical protein